MINNKGRVIIIGNFDGFHLGHKNIVEKAKEISDRENLETILLTFEPNPKVYFGIESKLINDCSGKIEIIKRHGISKIECLDFNKIHSMTGEFFIEKYLLKKYNMKFLVIGENFRLGKGKEWDVKKLISVQEKYNFCVTVISSVYFKGIKISSTKIRDILRHGDLKKANMMMGHPYLVSGIVEKGEKIGSKLGFPTINISISNSLLPKGVYRSKTEVDDSTFDSVTYIGDKPTFKKDIPVIETHIIGFRENLYGKRVKISFLNSIRKEKKFASREDLIRQIKEDLKAALIDK